MSVGLAILAAPASASAAGMWLSTSVFTPSEVRVAIAASPNRTTLWTSLSFATFDTTLALVLPVPAGTMVDVSPDAWFDALDQATAPRIYGPTAGTVCADGSTPTYEDPGCAAIAELTAPVESIPAASFDFLESPAAVQAWAADQGMAIPPSVAGNLAALQGSRFVAVRFIAGSSGVTQTVRVVMPNVQPTLVLSLFDPRVADHGSAFVTTWLIGPGRGWLEGTLPVSIDSATLVPNRCGTNNYVGALEAVLGAPGSALAQCAGSSFWTTTATADPGARFDSVLDAYFQGLAPGTLGAADPDGCETRAVAAMSSDETVVEACPPAAKGVVDQADVCRELPVTPGSSVEAAELSCGTADDVALALAGLRPDESWITRELLFLGVNTDDYAVTFAAGPFVMPVLHADGVLADFCPDEGTGGTGGSGATAPSSGGGCDSSAGGDGAEGAADGCDGAAAGLGDIGDIDCAAPRTRPRRSALWTLAFALLVGIGRLRRSRRNT